MGQMDAKKIAKMLEKANLNRIKHYEEMICKNQQVWLKSLNKSERIILGRQIEIFIRLKSRYATITARELTLRLQTKLF